MNRTDPRGHEEKEGKIGLVTYFPPSSTIPATIIATAR